MIGRSPSRGGVETNRKPYPSDVTDVEWEFCLPYLALISPEARQRKHDLREVFNALRYMGRSGEAWRMLPHDFPPWTAVQQQALRWFHAGVFEEMAHDLRAVLRVAEGRPEVVPSAVIMDSRTLQSTPESGPRAGYDGAKRKRGSKVHIAVDTLGHLLALHVTPACEQDRAQVAVLAEAAQAATGASIELAYVDQGYTGATAAADARAHGIRLEVVKLPGTRKGFVLLPRRWVVERTQAWLGRFRRLARDYERLDTTLAGMHWLAACILMLKAASILPAAGS